MCKASQLALSAHFATFDSKFANARTSAKFRETCLLKAQRIFTMTFFFRLPLSIVSMTFFFRLPLSIVTDGHYMVFGPDLFFLSKR